MTTELPLVLIVGATGWTGTSILRGLLKPGNFRISALVRPASVPKPSTQSLKAQGVEIRVGDITDGVAKLTAALAGVMVDTLISCIAPWLVLLQADLFTAANARRPLRLRERGRPGRPRPPRHELAIQSLGLGHTFVDVGWWMQLQYLPPAPPPLSESAASAGAGALKMSRHVYIHMLLTNLDHVGTYVADPRTLGGAVQVWEDEARAREIGESVSGDGDGDALRALRVPMTREELERWRDEGRAAVARDPWTADGAAQMKQGMSEYVLHLHFLQENTLDNVTRRLGYLDARALYPDISRHTLEDCADEFYGLAEPGAYYTREQEIKLP